MTASASLVSWRASKGTSGSIRVLPGRTLDLFESLLEGRNSAGRRTRTDDTTKLNVCVAAMRALSVDVLV